MKLSLNCQPVRESLDAFVVDALDPAMTQEIERHLAQCPECAAELQSIRLLRSRLRSAVLAERMPANLHENVMAALSETVRQPHRRQTWIPLTAAAALVLATALSWNVYRTWSGDGAADLAADRYMAAIQSRMSSIVKVALTDHVHCAVFRKYKNPPSEAQMQQDMGQFKALIPVVRKEVPSRYKLEQAHRCTSGNREYVHMIFRDHSTLISLIATVRRPGETLDAMRPSGESPFVRTAQVDQYQVAAFDAGPFLAYVVSDMAAQDNVMMAKSLASPVSGFLGTVAPVQIF